MSDEEFYDNHEIHGTEFEEPIIFGRITEQDRFYAAKQILLGLAILYVITIIAYLLRPTDGIKLIDICTTTFPPLATLILVFYFRQNTV